MYKNDYRSNQSGLSSCKIGGDEPGPGDGRFPNGEGQGLGEQIAKPAAGFAYLFIYWYFG